MEFSCSIHISTSITEHFVIYPHFSIQRIFLLLLVILYNDASHKHSALSILYSFIRNKTIFEFSIYIDEFINFIKI